MKRKLNQHLFIYLICLLSMIFAPQSLAQSSEDLDKLYQDIDQILPEPTYSDATPPLTIGVSVGYAPFAFNYFGIFQGFDIDMGKYMARVMNRRLKVIDYPYEDLTKSLKNNEVDCVISSITDNIAHKTEFFVSKPYYELYLAIVYNKDTKFNGIHSLTGKTVAVLKNTDIVDIVQEYTNNIEFNVAEFSKLNSIYDKLRNNRIDYAILSSSSAISLSQSIRIKYQFLDHDFVSEPHKRYYVALCNPERINTDSVDTAIETLREKKILDTLEQIWIKKRKEEHQ